MSRDGLRSYRAREAESTGYLIAGRLWDRQIASARLAHVIDRPVACGPNSQARASLS
jgi:hypothetical protein